MRHLFAPVFVMCLLAGCGRSGQMFTGDAFDAGPAEVGSVGPGCSIENLKRVIEVLKVQPLGAPWGMCFLATGLPSDWARHFDQPLVDACVEFDSEALFDCLGHSATEALNQQAVTDAGIEWQPLVEACAAQYPSTLVPDCTSACSDQALHCERDCAISRPPWAPCLRCTEQCVQSAWACLASCPSVR